MAIEFATVLLTGTGYHTTTNEKGEFEIKDIPAGKYKLQISVIGHTSIERELEVKAGKNTKVPDLKMEAPRELEEVSVVGKSESQQLKEQGFQVNVIDLKTQYNFASDMNQVLNRVSGVRIREEGGLGSNFNFSLNGFSGNQVKFFLDGIPMDKFGSSLTLNNFPVNIAERIEIYKGVIPVHLGTDALGGAINIIPRKNLNYVDASYSYGSFNTHRPAVSAAYTNEKTGFTVRLNTFYNYSDNNYKVFVKVKNLSTGNYDTPERWVRRFHDKYESGTVQLETGLVGKKYADRLLFGIIASGNNKDIQTGVVMQDVYGARISKSRSFIPTLKYKKSDLFVKGLDLSFYSAYNITTFQVFDVTPRIYNWENEFIPSSMSSGVVGGEASRTSNKNSDREFLTNANLNYRISPSQSIAVNYLLSNFRRSSHDAENPESYANIFSSKLTKQVLGFGWNTDIRKRFTSSVFLKLYQMHAEGYEAVVAVTPTVYQQVPYSYANPGYGLALAYFIYADLQAKASYEHSYRLPEGNEIFGDGLWIIYNPGLKPEVSENFNGGLRYTRTISKAHKLSAELGAIYRYTLDFIRVQQDNVTGARRQVINSGTVETKGIEGEIGYNFKKRFFATVNATYQKLIDRDEFRENKGFGGGVTRNYSYGYALPNIPYFFANANAGFNIPVKNNILSLNYSLNYVHEYYLVPSQFGSIEANADYIIPSQTAHNASVTYSMANGKYNISLEGRNLTDNLLYDSFKLQKPGRSFTVKVRYFISK